MKNEAENVLNTYLKQFARQLEDLPKKNRLEQLETIKTHVYEAIADQQGQLDEVEIVKQAVKGFNFPKKPVTIKDYVISYSVLIIVGIFLAILDFTFIYPQFAYSAAIPYFIMVLPGEIGFNLWKYFVGPHLPDKRYHLIYGWVYGLGLYLESLIVDNIIGFPVIGGFEMKWVIFIIYGIVICVFTGLSLVVPNEMMEKSCPSCLALLPMESEFCLKCGEQLE